MKQGAGRMSRSVIRHLHNIGDCVLLIRFASRMTLR
jgi:hypothetical protein